MVQTQKIRWIFPASGTAAVRQLVGLHAFALADRRSSLVEAEKPARGASGELVVCNGELLPMVAANPNRPLNSWNWTCNAAAT